MFAGKRAGFFSCFSFSFLEMNKDDFLLAILREGNHAQEEEFGIPREAVGERLEFGPGRGPFGHPHVGEGGDSGADSGDIDDHYVRVELEADSIGQGLDQLGGGCFDRVEGSLSSLRNVGVVPDGDAEAFGEVGTSEEVSEGFASVTLEAKVIFEVSCLEGGLRGRWKRVDRVVMRSIGKAE